MKAMKAAWPIEIDDFSSDINLHENFRVFPWLLGG